MNVAAALKIIPIIFELLPDDFAKKSMDNVLDEIEEFVEGTDNKIDDSVLLLTAAIRNQLNIPEYGD